MNLDARHKLFLILSSTFCTCLVVGDLIGGKLVSAELFGFPFTTTVGMVPFPVTFLLTDLLNEFYGAKAARLVTMVGLGMATLAFVLIYVAAAIPIAELTRAEGWQGVTEAAFDNVFLGSLRMLLASLAAYVIGQLIDIAVFSALRRWSRGKFLWLRATGSTAVSQLIDTVAITFIAWVQLLPLSEMLHIIVSAYSLKLIIAVALTPAIYGAHALVLRGLGIAPSGY